MFSVPSLLLNGIEVFLAAVSFQGFMIPNGFIDGGATGLSILFHKLFHIDISILLIVLNLPFI